MFGKKQNKMKIRMVNAEEILPPRRACRLLNSGPFLEGFRWIICSTKLLLLITA